MGHHLPFLVVYGRAIGVLLVVGGGVLGISGVWLLRRVLEARRLERERATLTRELRALSTGRATIRGRLRGRAASAFAHDGTVVRERSEVLAIHSEGSRIDVRGAVEVLAGTRAKASWRALPSGFVSKLERGAWRAGELRDGDEVIARGQLANIAGATDAAYRDAAGVWVLTPVTETPVVELFAARPAVRPAALGPVALACAGVVCAAISYLALWGIGSWLVADRPDLAAALPHVRDAALERLAFRLEHDEPRTDDILAQRLELAELQHGCAARARLEGQEQRWEAEAVDACGDPVATIDALAHLGYYTAAAALDARRHGFSPRSATIALAANDWGGAAVAADQLARALHSPRLVGLRGVRMIERTECYAAWFRAKAGDARAAKALAVLAPSNLHCGLARAMLLPPEERAAAFAKVADVDDAEQAAAVRDAKMLMWAYGAYPDARGPDPYGAAMSIVGESPPDRWVWLAALAARWRVGDVKIAAHQTVLDAIRGDFASATQRILDAAQHTPELADELEGLRAAIALHSPDPVVLDPRALNSALRIQELVMLRDGQVLLGFELIAERRARELTRALAESLSGDGAALAQALAADRPSWFDSGALLAVLPHVHAHRKRLAAALRNFDGGSGVQLERLPFDLLAQAAMRRDLARLANDTLWADRWQHLIDAQLPVLDDPDRLIALLLWQE